MPNPTILVIDDQPASLMSLAVPLREAGYTVLEAATVDAALTALVLRDPDAVVLDLALDRPSAGLHQVLVAKGLPVVVVSGIGRDALPATSESNGWSFLEKPVGDHALVAMLAKILPRATRAPEAPAPIVEAPQPEAPRAPASSPPAGYTDPSVQRVDALSRRALRGFCAALTVGMSIYFESRGHVVPYPIVISIAAMALGAQAVADAIRKRPGVTVGGAAVLVALALVGNATGVREAQLLAVIGTGALPVVDHLANAANAAVKLRGLAPLTIALAALVALG